MLRMEELYQESTDKYRKILPIKRLQETRERSYLPHYRGVDAE